MTAESAAKPHLSRDHLLNTLRMMVRIRRMEEKCAELYQQEKIRGFLHLYIGEEAIATGIMQALRPEDAIVATYREHGHALARGVSMNAIMAEMFGKVEGCSRGRGGSMHLFDTATRFYGGNAIVAGGLPLALGLGLAEKMQDRAGIAACFFGEGAVAEGEFHETMNLAELWRAPVLFICENNLYAMGTRIDFSEAETDLCAKARSYRVPAHSVDGMDVVAVEAAALAAVQAIRAGGGPQFLECRTYRLRAHSMFDPQLYRDKTEIESWKSREPIARYLGWLQGAGLIHDGEMAAIEAQADQEVAAAVAFAEAGHWEPVETLEQDVYTVEARP